MSKTGLEMAYLPKNGYYIPVDINDTARKGGIVLDSLRIPLYSLLWYCPSLYMKNLNGSFKSDEPAWVRLEVKGKSAILETKRSGESVVHSHVLRHDHDEDDNVSFWYENTDKDKFYGLLDSGEEIIIKKVQDCTRESFDKGIILATVAFYEE